MNIALVTTGGTLDKDYFDALSEYQVVESILLDEAQRLGLALNIVQHEVCRKDSLEVTREDRAKLAQTINAIDATHVLVSHGTDTMVDSAKYVAEHCDKTVVFFGAMRPARFKDSDAMFNFAFALGALKSLEPGCYLAMSAQIFKPDEVVKNRSAGRFEALD